MKNRTKKELISEITDLKKCVRDLENLLKEVHHRVKNNLQMIHSLLDLQAESVKDIYAIEKFKNSQNRVQSMALIHQQLYQSKNLTTIEMDDYIHSMISYLRDSYGILSERIDFRLEIESIPIYIDSAIPLGLIINELITNTIKHAFPDIKTPKKRMQTAQNEILIQLKKENGQCILTVSDNGIGLPKNYSTKNIPSLGLELVFLLAEQINGKIKINKSTGTSFIIKFPCQYG